MDFSPPNRDEYRRVNAAIAECALEFLEELLPGGHVDARGEYIGSGIEGGDGSSCGVDLTTGKWNDFAVEGDEGGDFISLWARVHDLEQHEALAACQVWLLPETNDQSLPVTKDPNWWRDHLPDRTWDYRDADGKLLFQVYRWEPRDGHKKEIRPWCPETGRYEYPPDLALRPLLALSAFQNSTKPVVLVGGEKCVEAVYQAGWTATTCAGGESAVSKTDYSPLADRDVLLWPDNDPAGESWAAKTMEALQGVGAASVRVYDTSLLGHRDGRDAADLQSNTVHAALTNLLAAKPVWREALEVYLSEITATDPPPREWLITGAIPRNVAAVLAGPGGCGKSIAVFDMCIKIATLGEYKKDGKPPETFLGPVDWEARGPSVFITLEDDINEIHRRAIALDPTRLHAKCPVIVLAGADEMDFNPVLMTSTRDQVAALTTYATVGLPRMMERVKAKAGMYPKLLVLDPIGDFLDGPEEDNAIVKPLMLYFRRMAVKYQCTILLVGHTPKAKPDKADPLGSISPRGASAWGYNSRAAFGLYRPVPVGAISFLKSIGVDPNPANISRVVFGGPLKENQPGVLHGVQKWLQDPNSGLLMNMTSSIREEKTTDERFLDMVVHTIKVGALVGKPFKATATALGMHSRRDDCLPELRHVGRDKLHDAVATLKIDERLRSCSINSAAGYIDVPEGPYATGVETATMTGAFPENAYEQYPFEPEGADT